MNETVLEDRKLFFWLKSGEGLKSIREMANALPILRDDEWVHHVNEHKNDFSDWIRDVFGERELAELLRQCRSKAEFQSRLYNHVVREEMRQKKEARAKKHGEEERAIIDEPERFAAYHQKDSTKKDAVADRFDEVTRRMEESLHPEEPADVEQRTEGVTERLTELRQRITEVRKTGKDPLIAELKLRAVPSKLAYARLTQQQRDFDKVEVLLEEADKEIADALAFVEPDVKKEVEMMAEEAQRPIEMGKETGAGAPGPAPETAPAANRHAEPAEGGTGQAPSAALSDPPVHGSDAAPALSHAQDEREKIADNEQHAEAQG